MNAARLESRIALIAGLLCAMATTAPRHAIFAQGPAPPTALVDVTVIDEVGLEPRSHSTILITEMSDP